MFMLVEKKNKRSQSNTNHSVVKSCAMWETHVSATRLLSLNQLSNIRSETFIHGDFQRVISGCLCLSFDLFMLKKPAHKCRYVQTCRESTRQRVLSVVGTLTRYLKTFFSRPTLANFFFNTEFNQIHFDGVSDRLVVNDEVNLVFFGSC